MQIKANGIMLEVEQHGPKDGTPLILIRGLGSQIIHWPAELMLGFADLGYRVVTFDNRDVGLSQRFPIEGRSFTAADIIAEIEKGSMPEPAYALSDMAQDVVGLMDALAIDKAHVLGISMGGGIAQLLAIQHPDRLLSDTIVMTAARLRDPSMIEGLLVHPETRNEAMTNAVANDNFWGSHGYPMTESEIREQAAQAYDRGDDPEGNNRQLLATLSSPDRSALLGDVALPCFVIHGAIDTLIPPDAGREIAALIPNAKLKIVEGMGHVITPKLSSKIVEMVHKFISEIAA